MKSSRNICQYGYSPDHRRTRVLSGLWFGALNADQTEGLKLLAGAEEYGAVRLAASGVTLTQDEGYFGTPSWADARQSK